MISKPFVTTTNPSSTNSRSSRAIAAKKVLEVGYGAATDFIQWARAGARLTGIDLTPEAFEHARHRLEIYGLPQPEDFRVGDAEKLPFESNTFDLGYSFGVLHHTPDTIKAIGEVARVVKPGGEIKIMIYNRRSIYAYNTWVKNALLKGRPFKSVAWALWNHMESAGTKSYTRAEIAGIFSKLPVERVTCKTEITAADYLSSSAFAPLNLFYHFLVRLAGERYPWLASEFHVRTGPPEKRSRTRPQKSRAQRNRFHRKPTRIFPLHFGHQKGLVLSNRDIRSECSFFLHVLARFPTAGHQIDFAAINQLLELALATHRRSYQRR
jgi:ubiquinone/menaquinone biosynthesis C-methylase UbiE